jgi:hypothetical protein
LRVNGTGRASRSELRLADLDVAVCLGEIDALGDPMHALIAAWRALDLDVVLPPI